MARRDAKKEGMMLAVNGVMLQYFEWYLPDNGTLWRQLGDEAESLAQMGFTAVWIPPCCKATGSNDTGYGMYDGYDLGEFDQKGTVRTKYGTRQELREAIGVVQKWGLSVYADVVLNHKAGADETQRFPAVEVNPENRNEALTEPYEIEGWTRFTFPGRGGRHSAFQWSWEHFNGTDYNAENGKEGIYLIVGENKGWAEGVAVEFGNYDYLMFANIDYQHPDVREETFSWISWFIRETGVDGIRLDAIKHINDWFIRDLIGHVRETFGQEFYCVGEFWEPDRDTVHDYLEEVDGRTDLFDVALHHRFREASQQGEGFDLRTIFDGSLVQTAPEHAVTFVDNHDSQPGQDLGFPVEHWFRPLAYGLILLRAQGYPCVFYGDLYGTQGEHPLDPSPDVLRTLLWARQEHCHGEQLDYFEDTNLVGWVRTGNREHPEGCAVVLSNGGGGSLRMDVGEGHAGEVWSDRMPGRESRVTIGEGGVGDFMVPGGAIALFVREG